MLSAYFTLTLVTLHYLIDHHHKRNSVDKAFLGLVVPKRLTIQTQETSERWTRAFEAAVLFMGDTQIVTSLAILLSGYVQLPCSLSTYHWEMIVDLAWFSALTHLAALTSLRYYLRRRPAMAVWRVLFMGITLILLSSALYPTGYVFQTYNAGYDYILTLQDLEHFLSSPALCLLRRHTRAELTENLSSASNAHTKSKIDPPFNTALIAISLIYLTISYLTRVIKLSRSAAEFTNNWLRIKPITFLCNAYGAARMLSFRSRILSSIVRGPLLVCITMAEAVYEIGNSMLWEICWLAAALIWGTFRLVVHRHQSRLVVENTWGFGQVLALILSTLPLWSFFSNLQENVLTPLHIDTNPTNLPVIDGLGQLDQYSWFNGLVSFIFGTALTLAGGTVYQFSGSSLLGLDATDEVIGYDELYRDTSWVAMIYVIAIGCTTFAAMIFTAVALAFHYQKIPSSKISRWWRRRTVNLSLRAQEKILSWAWIVLMMMLIGAQLMLYLLAIYWEFPYVADYGITGG